jgi:competence protein ComGC
MKNKAAKISTAVIVLIISAVIVLTVIIDSTTKSSIEENGSELFQSVVTVNDVNISLFSGKGSIKGFKIQNPGNFSDEPALSIEEATIEIDLRSLLSDQIRVNEIIVKSPELFFEQKGLDANLKMLNDNMNLTHNDPDEKTIIIDYLHIEEGNVVVSTSIDRQRTAEANFSEITLTDIGRDGNNSIKQSVRQIIEPLLQKAINEAIKGGVTEQLKNKIQDVLNN